MQSTSSLPVIDPLVSAKAPKAPRTRKRKIITLVVASVAAVVVAIAAAFMWYSHELTPVAATDETKTRITIVSGSTPSDIAQLLYEKQLIRSTTVFDIYTKLAKNRNNLQAGSYVLSPSQPLSEIVEVIASGKVESFSIMFYPGGMLTDRRAGVALKDKMDAESVLLRAGYSQEAITAAFAKQYSSPLLAGKSAGASLEGYIYGDTYMLDSSMSVEQVLEATFAEYYRVLSANDLITGFKKQGLTLHEGIIMASIVQSEMGVHEADMAQVAQIFLKRYRAGDPLGSDVTAYYGADLLRLPRAVTVDTPYNTRMHPGLPKGPISSPGLAALKAVANPAPGEYVYFLSGDDGVTYFANTEAQHQKNIADHCKIGCAIP